jgi:hypothetical protein
VTPSSSARWRSKWSPATIEAATAETDDHTLLAAVQRDVHGALVAWEADGICRASHIDQRRRWRLAATGVPPEAQPPDGDGEVDEIVSLSIIYSDLRSGITGDDPESWPPQPKLTIAARRPGP